MTVLPDPPRSALIDARTGLLAREWTRFFDELRRAIVSGLDDAVGGRLDALEADSLFGGGGDAGGSGSSYNDSAVRDRLDALETDLLFAAASGSASGDASVLAERVALLEEEVDGLGAEAALAVDPSAALAELRRRLGALELAQAMAVDAEARIRLALRRLADLETEGLFS